MNAQSFWVSNGARPGLHPPPKVAHTLLWPCRLPQSTLSLSSALNECITKAYSPQKSPYMRASGGLQELQCPTNAGRTPSLCELHRSAPSTAALLHRQAPALQSAALEEPFPPGPDSS